MCALDLFFSENGIVMNGISIQSNESVGMHVRAERKLKEGQVVARIPKNVVLSVKNTAIADVLQEYEIAGLLGLTLAVMFEQAKGQASPWFEYLISLPEKVDIPLLWDANQIHFLDGTELGESVMQDQMALREDYDSIILPILKEPVFCPLEEFSFEKFQNASSLVSSRAFDVDEYHQHSMVPLADM
jgi:hypothetical protein